jgi:hypothetical protein
MTIEEDFHFGIEASLQKGPDIRQGKSSSLALAWTECVLAQFDLGTVAGSEGQCELLCRVSWWHKVLGPLMGEKGAQASRRGN